MDTIIEFEKMLEHDFKLMRQGRMSARISYAVAFIIFAVSVLVALQVFSYMIGVFNQGFILSFGIAFLAFMAVDVILGVLLSLFMKSPKDTKTKTTTSRTASLV